MTVHWKDLPGRLEGRLQSPLPGIPAQLRMVPEPRPGNQPYYEVEETSLKAGVLLLLFPRDGRLCLLLTRRTETVLHHRGQISLPGGEQHPGESVVETAVRETEEELGLCLDGMTILGGLTPLYIPPSNYCVYPVVGVLPEAPVFCPHPAEVAEVIEVPLEHLMDPGNIRKGVWTIHGNRVEVPYYEYGDHKIWGATAMILAEFLAVVGDEIQGERSV